MFSCFKSGESAELRSLRSRITELESKLLDKEKNQVHVCLSRRPLWLSGSLSASFANIFAFLILILSRLSAGRAIKRGDGARKCRASQPPLTHHPVAYWIAFSVLCQYICFLILVSSRPSAGRGFRVQGKL